MVFCFVLLLLKIFTVFGNIRLVLKHVLKGHLAVRTFYPSSVPTGLVVSVKMVHGELEQATKENPLLLKNVCVTKKLGFSDVIMPGDVRYGLTLMFYYKYIPYT